MAWGISSKQPYGGTCFQAPIIFIIHQIELLLESTDAKVTGRRRLGTTRGMGWSWIFARIRVLERR